MKRYESFGPAALSGLVIGWCVLLVSASALASVHPDSLDESTQAAYHAAMSHVREQLPALGLSAEDVADLRISDAYASRHNGVTHIYLQQHVNGIGIHNALINVNVMPDGSILHSGNRAYGALAKHDLAAEPVIAAGQAVEFAAQDAGLDLVESLQILQMPAGEDRSVVFSDAGISLEPIPARLVYAPDDRGQLRLAWRVEIYERSAQHYWVTFVDAESGTVLFRDDQVIHDRWDSLHAPAESEIHSRVEAVAPRLRSSAAAQTVNDGSSYRVFEMPKEHPNDGPRTLVAEPAHAAASPFGWHDTNGAAGAEYTITRGNNVHAYQDRNNSNSSSGDEPDGGAGLDFDFGLDLGLGPDQYIDAAVTNLFYWNNLHHDLSYVRGFDEPAGNFQVNNYGNGGAGGDDVRAEAQDGADVGNANNANFFTPNDGSRPRMQMFIWTLTSPNRDGDLDAGIILHEYGHGISIRQTGGPNNSSCLSNSEQAGEGWSDWQSLIYTAVASDTATTKRGVGTYSLGQPVDGDGIRAFPYSTDMGIDPRTYADTQSAAVPHGVGSIWTAILWEVYWKLVDEYGFNPDFYADWDQGGNLLAMQLVNDGLKLQPCSPGFVDGRDAILAADVALTGGANQCLLWEAFAKRGLGLSANQGSSGSNSDNTEAFDIPVACQFGEATPPEQMACLGDPVDYDITLGSAWSAPVNLSVSGHPGDASFSQNPVTAPGSSTLTIDNTGGEAAGSYNLTVEGDDGTDTETFPLVLELFDLQPGSTTLTAPANGAGNVPFRPMLSWSAAPEAVAYQVEIATDAGFVNIVHSAEVTGTSHQPPSALAADTLHYWRVQAINPCGSGTVSDSFSFTTATSSLVCGGTESFESGIPDDWTVTNDSASGNGIVWVTTADVECGIENNTTGSGEAACADSDYPGSGNSPAYDTSLLTPPLDLSGYTSASLDVRTYFQYWNTSQMNIEVWDGADWNVVWTVDTTGSNDVNVDLDAYAGSSNAQVRFRYLGDGWDYRAQVDDVTLNCSGVASHTVTAAVGSGSGSITPASQPVDHGNSASFTVTPDTGWSVDSVTGDSCSPSDAGGGNWMASNITADCAVTADFQLNSYTVTPSAGAGGSVTPSTPQAVDYGQTMQFTLTPDSGYMIDSVDGGCGGSLAGAVYTTGPVTGDCAFEATFQVLVDEVFDDRFEGQ